MKILKNLSVLFLPFALLLFIWWMANSPHPETWLSGHSEISEVEICGERMVEQTMERSRRVTVISSTGWLDYGYVPLDSFTVIIDGDTSVQGTSWYKYDNMNVADSLKKFWDVGEDSEIGSNQYIQPKNHFGKILDSLNKLR